ncbi:MAG: divalent-cation tolerance protein CutA [Candidatus Omnitrophota bacterium]
MMEAIVVFVSVGTEEEADRIARFLVEKKLAACCSLIDGVRSVYRWQGVVEQSREVVMMIKTCREVFPALEVEIKRLHSYDVPEIIALPIIAGHSPYLQWLETSMS